MTIVIFRTYREAQDQLRSDLYRELDCGRLRQGWGLVAHPSMRLLDDQGDLIPQSAWEDNYRGICHDWGNPSPHRYTILTRMLELERDDVIIVPNMPNDMHFTLARVTEGYRFEVFIQHDGNEHEDFGHIINVEPGEAHRYDESNHTHSIADGIKPYRDAVNIVYHPDRQAQIHRALRALQ